MSDGAIALAVMCVLAAVGIYYYYRHHNELTTTTLIPSSPQLQDPRLRGDPRGEWGHQLDPWDPRTGPWSPFVGGPRPSMQPRQTNLSQRGLAQSGVDPDRIAEAEREAWYASDASTDAFASDPAMASGRADDATFGGAAEGMDYSRYTTDQVVDPRMRENHRKWVEEMGPWSGSTRNIDNLDEAMEASSHFLGLRRPQMVPVDNPTQVTELGPEHYAGNAKFNFRG